MNQDHIRITAQHLLRSPMEDDPAGFQHIDPAAIQRRHIQVMDGGKYSHLQTSDKIKNLYLAADIQMVGR